MKSFLRTHGWRMALGAGALLLLLSLAVTLYPEPPATPLLAANGITIDYGFVPIDPPKDFELRASILHSKSLALWRSWTPEHGSQPAKAHSLGFRMPAYLAVPYTGFAGDPGIRFEIECIETGRRMPVATGRTNTQWSEVLIARPRQWCVGDSRLLVESESKEKYVGFGAPWRISGLAYAKSGAFGLLAPFALVFALVAGVCVLFSALSAIIDKRLDALAVGIAGLGLCGYALFFVFYHAQAIGVWASAGLMALAGIGIARFLFRRRGHHGDATLWQWPLLTWFTISLFYLLLLFAGDNGAGAWLANSRFTPVRWSTDNQLPMLIGEYLARLDISKLDLGAWQLSDRTPLAYGLHAWLRAGLLPLFANDDGAQIAWRIQTVIGIVINSAWVPVATHMLCRLQVPPKRIVLLLATLALLPFCLFNSVYVWPKLLSGTFGLLAIWVLYVDPDTQANPAPARWALAALLSALALLTHGGAVFAVVAMLLLALRATRWPSLPWLVAAAAVAAGTLLPWMLWQKFVQPPGNALLKSVFAGTFGFNERSMGVLETISRSYHRISFSEWLAMKYDALATLLLPHDSLACGVGEMADGRGGFAGWRIIDFLNLAPSLKFLCLGALVWAIPALRPASESAEYRAGRLLLGTGVLAVGITALVSWDCLIIHTQSYQAVLAIAIGLLLLLQASPRPRLLPMVAALSIAYSLLVWVLLPLRAMPRVDVFALIAIGVLFLFAAFAVARTPTSS